jgi:hypothetical protein
VLLRKRSKTLSNTLVFSINNHRESAEAIPQFQLEQIKTPIQKTRYAAQKPKREKTFSSNKISEASFT